MCVDLSVLSSWAEALAEAGSADEVDAVLADAAAGATWRAAFGLEQPSDAARFGPRGVGSSRPIRRRTQRRPTTRSCVWSAASSVRPARHATEEPGPLPVNLRPVADLAAIDDAIAALEAQRGLLGDAVVDTAIEPLRAQREELVGRAVAEQRKLVTVLFSDLVDFTVLSQQLDAEDVRTVIDAYFVRWNEHIEANGGVVEKFIGDAVMAVFGLHRADEQDPHRAIRAALSMRSSLDELNAEVGLGVRRHARDARRDRHRRGRDEHAR